MLGLASEREISAGQSCWETGHYGRVGASFDLCVLVLVLGAVSKAVSQATKTAVSYELLLYDAMYLVSSLVPFSFIP